MSRPMFVGLKMFCKGRKMTSYCRTRMTFSAHQKATVGDMKFSAINSDHMGWLKCDGRLLNVDDFSTLFDVVGYDFGGEGSQFALPNPAGRGPGAIGTAEVDGLCGSTARLRGDIVGEEEHKLTILEMPIHNHGDISGSNVITGYSATGITTSNAGGHSHNLVTTNDDFNFSSGNWPATSTQTGMFSAGSAIDAGTMTWTGGTSAVGDHTHGISDPTHAHTLLPAGGDECHNNMQPTLFIGNMFIFCGKLGFSGAPSSAAGKFPYTTGTAIF